MQTESPSTEPTTKQECNCQWRSRYHAKGCDEFKGSWLKTIAHVCTNCGHDKSCHSRACHEVKHES